MGFVIEYTHDLLCGEQVLDELKVFYKKTMKLTAGGQQLVAERVKPNSNIR